MLNESNTVIGQFDLKSNVLKCVVFLNSTQLVFNSTRSSFINIEDNCQ